jgi:dienelactone hydrolase
MRIGRTVIWLALCLAATAARSLAETPAEVRAEFLKMIDRPVVPADAELTPMKSPAPLVEFHFTFAVDAQERVPGILLKNTTFTGRRPVVICLHGTGGNKSDEFPLMRILAERGFIGVAIDGPFHGERCKAGRGTVDYQAAIIAAWREQKGHPFYYETVWDMMRLIDYLDTRDDVDSNRIGMYGVSKGGIETYLTAAIDPRVSVAVPCIGLESFQWAVQNEDWQTRISTVQHAFDVAAQESNVMTPNGLFVHQFYERVCPGIDGEFDGPAMVRLIAPRPMMAINGDSDSHTPLGGLKLCTDAAEEAYGKDGAGDRFVEVIEKHTAHRVNPEAQERAVEWLVKWLEPG